MKDSKSIPSPTESVSSQPAWDREPDPCWSCGGEAEARDDIHVRCIDTKNVNCEVMDHTFTRRTWNTRVEIGTQEDSVNEEENRADSQGQPIKNGELNGPHPPREDPTQFTTRSFAMIWNEGHSIRLINRDNPRWAISIPWDEIPALRALLKGTYPVGGGEV